MMERSVTFECGHTAERRFCKDGRSLVGEMIRCHECHRDQEVRTESPARPLSVERA